MQYQRPVLRQEQKFKLTPQLYQAIKLMSLPIQDLRAQIQEEIERNPALEVLEDKSTVLLEDVAKKDTEYDIFEETSDPGYTRREGEEASDLKRKFLEGTITRPESLREHLIWQLRLQPITKDEYRIGERLIRNLDENGFHMEPVDGLFKNAYAEVAAKMLAMIQTFEPVGVATQDYQESLLVQIENHVHPAPYSLEIVRDHLKLLEKNRNGEMLKKLKISEEELTEAVEFIKTLDPIPGREYSTETPRYVIPDVIVRMKEGQFFIVLNDEEIPVLGINPYFTEISQDKSHKNEKELNHFITANINDAKWFIRSIGQRNQTLLKTCRVIVEFQRDFFRKGPKYLAPLTLKDIAREIDVHEATVSRISNGKYIQTEWGIFELKYFFSNSISGSGSLGSKYSKQAVKEIIKEIIEQEKGMQLSDKKIAEILAARGINIARRTVTKYRKELDIDSSFQR